MVSRTPKTRITNLTAGARPVVLRACLGDQRTAGHAYVQNLNANLSVSINFGAPSGTALLGELAEWIVESPSVGGSLATLPTYGLDFFSGSIQARGGTVHKPGSRAQSRSRWSATAPPIPPRPLGPAASC